MAVPVVAALVTSEWVPGAASSAVVVVTGAVGVLAMAWAGDSLATALRTQDAAAVELAQLQVRRAATVERVRIARDLHDTVAGDLAGASMVAATLVQRLEREEASESTQHLARALLETCREAHADTRVALGELRRAESYAPDDLVETCSRWSSRTGIPVRVDVDVRLGQVSRALTDDLRAVLLELLENVRRHARAQKVEVQVTVERGVVRLSVTDDGCGLDEDVTPTAGHYGVTGILERAQSWGGDVSSERPPDGGLRCVVSFRETASEVA